MAGSPPVGKHMIYHGSCHCKTVTFEIEAPQALSVISCNCSICHKTGFKHLIVPKSQFRLLTGSDALSTYTFNTHVAKHTFCKHCGVKAFYTPRSNPDGVDVNTNCLDTPYTLAATEQFDGQNWEQHAHTLEHLSDEK